MRRKGEVEIASHVLLDLLCFDPATHSVTALRTSPDLRELYLTIEGPDMPEEIDGGGMEIVTPTYRRKDWERLSLDTGA